MQAWRGGMGCAGVVVVASAGLLRGQPHARSHPLNATSPTHPPNTTHPANTTHPPTTTHPPVSWLLSSMRRSSESYQVGKLTCSHRVPVGA